MASVDEFAEPTLIEGAIKDYPVVSATVFADRAEVSRLVTVDAKGAGTSMLQLTGLIECADPDSIRVKTDSGVCNILEVTFDVHHKALGSPEETGRVAEARAFLASKEDVLDGKEAERNRLSQRDALTQSYLTSMLTARPATKEEPKVGTNVSAVRELLAFHEEASAASDTKLLALVREIELAKREVEAARSALKDATRGDSRKGGTQSSRDVSIIFSVPEGTGATAPLVLRLTYNVSRAGWTPSYDLRVEQAAGTKKTGSQNTGLQLTYFGVVRQSTGEDWAACQLSLSTATPSAGGTPPAPPTRIVNFASAYSSRGGQIFGDRNRANSLERMPRRHGGLERRMAGGPRHRLSAGPPMQALMSNAALPERKLSIEARELDMSDDSDLEDEEGKAEEDGGQATTTVSESSGGSSTFSIERRTAIASDAKDHKVCIGIIDLAPQFRYFCTPNLETKAYLQVRAINSSAFPLLASEKVSVFFDGSFVCTTNLKQIFPGESFSAFLGCDSAVKVEHKLVKKSTSEGKESGFMSKKVDSTLTYEYVTLVHNTKPRDAIELTVVEILPRSNDEKIVVELLQPTPDSLAEPQSKKSGGAAAAALSTGENQLKPGTVMQNKITNNIVFSKTLDPGQKAEIPFSYSVQWPHDRKVEIF